MSVHLFDGCPCHFEFLSHFESQKLALWYQRPCRLNFTVCSTIKILLKWFIRSNMKQLFWLIKGHKTDVSVLFRWLPSSFRIFSHFESQKLALWYQRPCRLNLTECTTTKILLKGFIRSNVKQLFWLLKGHKTDVSALFRWLPMSFRIFISFWEPKISIVVPPAM